jgi:hypothetical protein
MLSRTKVKGAPLVLSPPFDCLKVMPSKGTCGRCYAFCLTSSGQFFGYDFPKGYRILNSPPDSIQNKIFFLECRNNKRKKSGYVAAMLQSTSSRRKANDPGCLITHCDLVVVEGIFSDCSDPPLLHHRIHVLKKNIDILDFVLEPDLHNAIPSYFEAGTTVPVDSVKLLYLNTILGDHTLLHPYFRNDSYLVRKTLQLPSNIQIEGSLGSADLWFQYTSTSTLSKIEPITSSKRFCRLGYKKWIDETLPWSNQKLPTDLLIVTDQFKPTLSLSSPELSQGLKVYLIPYEFGGQKQTVSFVPITKFQLDKLKTLPFPISPGEYRKCLREFLSDSGLQIVKVIRIFPSIQIIGHSESERDKQVGGCIVGHLPESGINSFDTEREDIIRTEIDGIYLMRLKRNIPDVRLPFNCVSVFRGYQWPYATNIPQCVFNVLAKTFPDKGLTRRNVPHGGNFEMIGRKMSGQATGSMVAYRDTSKHQYYRATMDSSLIPSARGSINFLQEESLRVGYTSGESLMSLYRKIIKLDTLKDLCEQTIVTQKHFYNALHLDESCRIHDCYFQKVINSEAINSKERRYLENVMVLMQGRKLPKATTCCWTQRSKCKRQSKMFQYFVSGTSGFAYDISSQVTDRLEYVGATFHSSLFEHCTSVPVWTSSDYSEICLAPYDDDNYNFAWGSNGGPKDDNS